MTAYRLVYSGDFKKEFRKLDPSVQKLVASWIKKYLEGTTDPRRFGKALKGDKKGLWRYRIADYRLLVEIRGGELIILVLTFGYRRDIYS